MIKTVNNEQSVDNPHVHTYTYGSWLFKNIFFFLSFRKDLKIQPLLSTVISH